MSPVSAGWSHSTDFLCIGSGGGGLTGALAAAASGASALVLEKEALLGGTTAISGGVMWLPCNPLLAEAGIDDSAAAATDYLATLAGGSGRATSAERIEAFVAGAPALVDFLRREGLRLVRCVGMPDYHDELPGGAVAGRAVEPAIVDATELDDEWRRRLPSRSGLRARLAVNTQDIGRMALMTRTRRGLRVTVEAGLRTTAGMARGRRPIGNGTALIVQLLQACRRRRIPIWPEAAVTELILDGGRVVGVVARRGKEAVRIQARRGVLIAGGGFAHNAAMRRRFQGHDPDRVWTMAAPGDTGELQQMAIDLGAATEAMDESWWFPSTVWPDGMPFMFNSERAKPHGIVVDGGAERYVDEACDYMSFGQAMWRRDREVAAVPLVRDGRAAPPPVRVEDDAGGSRPALVGGQRLPAPGGHDSRAGPPVRPRPGAARADGRALQSVRGDGPRRGLRPRHGPCLRPLLR